MSDEIREQLSALVDGELPRDQVRFLLRRIDADTQLVQTWMRYQMAGDVLRRRGTPLSPLRDEFAEVVMRGIGEQRSGTGLRLLRWAGGGAIAAAVAVFALVSTRPTTDVVPAASLASVPAVAAAPAEPARDALPTVPLQPAFDFAQPASFISLPHYRREQPLTLGPYVLLTAPATQTADASSQH